MKIESATLTKAQLAPENAKLKQAVQEFEALFLGQVLKDMRQTIPESGLFGQGPEDKLMRDLMDEEWAKQMASGRGMGLAQVLYRQLAPQS